MAHWFDDLMDHVRPFLGDKRNAVVNGGLSVSGLQHVGRLRGEIVLGHCISRALRDTGLRVAQILTKYTQDQWKGKDWQLSQFPADTGKGYVGWRLIDVPDPHGCHGNWVDHYWAEFAVYLDAYAPDVHVVSTTELYRREDMRAIVAELAPRAEEVRQIVNKYRGRRPYPFGWIPFEPYCNACKRVGSARAVRILGTTSAEYECDCGDRGSSPLELGKLNWRLEWPAVWKILNVDIEPFGKDHAAPGGSRDSCKDLAQTLMGFTPPYGVPYEWVGLGERGVDKGDMGSSDAIGFGPGTWAAVGDPEVLRYAYLSAPASRRIVLDLSKMDVYHDAYDAGENAHYGKAATEEEQLHDRAFSLAAIHPPPNSQPYALSYRHAAYLSQIAPGTDRLPWVLTRLEDTGMLDRPLSDGEQERVGRRLNQARAWVDAYAPENRVVLLNALTEDVRSALDEADRRALAMWASSAIAIDWREEEIKESMVSMTKEGHLPVSTPRFFRALYLVLLGKERGPRAAPFLAVLDREWVLARLAEAAA